MTPVQLATLLRKSFANVAFLNSTVELEQPALGVGEFHSVDVSEDVCWLRRWWWPVGYKRFH